MGSTTFTIPSDIASGQSIQLSYPITNVQPPTISNGDTVFYLMTPGVTFNMAYIDSVNSRSLSGYSSQAIIHKSFHLPNESNAEICIVHQKTNSNDKFYLAIPLKSNPNAKSNLSAYLNSNDDNNKLDIGSDIAGSDIVHYQNSNDKDVFVVVNPVEVNIPNNITLSEIPTIYSNASYKNIARIKTTSTNDEIVCDYEGDITEDANKSSETKEAEMNLFWANVVPVIIVGVVYLLCMQINASSIEPKSILIGYVVLAILFGIVAIVFSALIKKTDSKRVNYYGIYAATSWLLFLLFAVFAVLKASASNK